MGLGQTIRKVRLAKGLTLDKLEELSGVASGTIHALEARDSSRSQYFPALAKALGLTVEELHFPDRIALKVSGENFAAIHSVENPDETAMFSRRTAFPTMDPILSWEHEADLPDGEFVMVPRLEVRLSAGGGMGGTQVEIEFNELQAQAFRAEWIRQQRLRPNKLAAMRASGNSMEPTIHDGDSLLIDTSQVEVIDGKVYALWYEGGERVKRLYRMPPSRRLFCSLHAPRIYVGSWDTTLVYPLSLTFLSTSVEFSPSRRTPCGTKSGERADERDEEASDGAQQGQACHGRGQ